MEYEYEVTVSYCTSIGTRISMGSDTYCCIAESLEQAQKDMMEYFDNDPDYKIEKVVCLGVVEDEDE